MSLDLFSTFGDRVRLRVDEVLNNRNCHWAASEDEKSLLRALLGTRGVKQTKTRQQLVDRLKVSDRAIREMVHNLRLNFACQIGSSRSADGGYYLMDDEQDAVTASQQLISQGVAIIRAGIALRGGRHDEVELLGQIALVLNAEPQQEKR